jgi:hypothetical protein
LGAVEGTWSVPFPQPSLVSKSTTLMQKHVQSYPVNPGSLDFMPLPLPPIIFFLEKCTLQITSKGCTWVICFGKLHWKFFVIEHTCVCLCFLHSYKFPLWKKHGTHSQSHQGCFWVHHSLSSAL